MTILEKNCVQNELLASHTSWKIGGRADIFFSPNSRDELSEFLKSNDCSITWLGNGTNILIRDGGVRGAVISTKKSFNNIQLLDRSNCKVEAGVSCFELAMHLSLIHI